MQNKTLATQETNQNNQTSNQKYPQTLEEQRDYYFNLFKKSAGWQKSEEIKVKNEKLWSLLQKVDFKDMKETYKNKINSKLNNIFLNYFCEIAELDYEIKEIVISEFNVLKISEKRAKEYVYQFVILRDLNFQKPLKINSIPRLLYSKENLSKQKQIGIFLGGIFAFQNATGLLHLSNLKSYKLKLDFQSCNFSHITLENFDRGYFSPQTNDYLNQMEKEEKLTLINCTFSGLPVVRENFEATQSKNQKIFEFTKLIKSEHRSAFAQYLSGFVNFLEETQNKHISLDISLNGGLIFKASSNNQDDLENIEKYLLKYMAIPPLVSQGQRPSIEISTGINPNNVQTILIALESDVHNLETKMKLKNAKLMLPQEMTNELEGIFLKMKQEMSGLNIEIKQINYKNKLLLDENLELLEKIKTIKEELRTMRLREITTDDKVDILINLLGHITLALGDKQDKNLLNKAVEELKTFYNKDQAKLALISIIADGKSAFSNLKEVVESIINLF
jgi:hypothetical protein